MASLATALRGNTHVRALVLRDAEAVTEDGLRALVPGLRESAVQQ